MSPDHTKNYFCTIDFIDKKYYYIIEKLFTICEKGIKIYPKGGKT